MSEPKPVPAWLRAVEVLLVVGVGVYCLAVPRRIWVDLGLFAVASLVIAELARRGGLPAPPDQPGKRTAAWVLAALTGLAVVGMVGYRLVGDGGLEPRVMARVALVYVAYASVQQFLTQRYLAVRVHAWLRRPDPWKSALAVAALFAVAHLPWPRLIMPTMLVGFLWSWAYLRLGRVWPIALSHIALAVAFFGCVLGYDPFQRAFGG